MNDVGRLLLRYPRFPGPRSNERGLLVEAEGGDEGFLGNFDAADLLHALLALLLALEQLALARDVTAVALREDVLALRLHRLAGDDPAAHRRLDRHVEQLARNELAQLRRHAPA